MKGNNKKKQKKDPTDVSFSMRNRTGATASPKDAAEQRKASDEHTLPSPPPSPADVHALCGEYERSARPLGTMPPPSTLKGAAKTMVSAMKGEKASALLDMLGDRLAFERTGVRLYEGLLAKLDHKGSFGGGPSRDELVRFCDEELHHFHLVKDAILELGADPTTMTPMADVSAVASEGVVKVVAEPRSTLADALHAIHIAELADNDGWQLLIEQCEATGHDDMAERFKTALVEENRHLAAVRRWLRAHASEVVQREDGERKERPAGEAHP